MTQITQSCIPQGYFSEITMYHLRPLFASTHRWLLRSVKAMLASKLTLVYAQYHQMSNLQSLVASDYEESYEHAELMASFLSQLLPSRPTSPSELMHSKEEELLPLNPANGWGNYDQLLAFTLNFLQHLIPANDDFEIYASR